MLKKPIVRFSLNDSLLDSIKLNKNAIIKPINHPSKQVSNRTLAVTSGVINMTCSMEKGQVIQFETINTIYIGE